MSKRRTSSIGDLTPLAKELEEVIRRHAGAEERPAIAIAFTLPPNYDECHWVTNVPRDVGIRLFADTAAKMTAQTN